jgi:DNA mismatch repair protein MutL
MQQQIRVLPEALVNQIAAGEVVERPASVVKELVENALDAGATSIRISLVDGGTSGITVVDDGCGMSRADALLAFERHATSKIRDAGDLACVQTLGFRGEALPSIASVARVRMLTRRAPDAVGTELRGEGRGIEQVRDAACPAGTRVEIGELFENVPARRKFLKSPATEGAHALRWLERMALARSDVRFELERDGRPALLFLPTAEPRERMLAALPPGLGDQLVPVAGDIPTASVRGFASPTHLMRGGSDGIHLFVNARPVRDRLLLFAVREAYRDALPSGRHPIAVLFLQVDPAEVDVNVHPAKAEVRFRDPAAIQQLVRRSLRAAAGVGSRSAARPPLEYSTTVASTSGVADAPAPADFAWAAQLPLTSHPVPEAGRHPLVFRSLRYVGQVLGGYLVCEREGQVVLLDQHAAHERVLFERLRSAAARDKVERQALLEPLCVELSRSAADALLAERERLERVGFELEELDPGAWGRARVALRALPAPLVSRADVSWAELLDQTASWLRDPTASEARDGIEAALHHIAATAACHAAARKGDRLSPREVEALLAALDETVWLPNCPHGRPIMAALDQAEIERRFLRRP